MCLKNAKSSCSTLTRSGSHEVDLEWVLVFCRPFLATYQQLISLHDHTTSKKCSTSCGPVLVANGFCVGHCSGNFCALSSSGLTFRFDLSPIIFGHSTTMRQFGFWDAVLLLTGGKQKLVGCNRVHTYNTALQYGHFNRSFHTSKIASVSSI